MKTETVHYEIEELPRYEGDKIVETFPLHGIQSEMDAVNSLRYHMEIFGAARLVKVTTTREVVE